MKHEVSQELYQNAVAICGEKKKTITLPLLQYKLKASYSATGKCIAKLIDNGILKKKDDDFFKVVSPKERELEQNNKARRLAAIVNKLSREAKLFCIQYLPRMPIEGGHRVYRLISNDDIKEILVQLHEYEIIELTPHSIAVKLNNDELSLFLSQIKEEEPDADAEKSKFHFRFERGRKAIRDFFDKYNDDDETEEDDDDNEKNDDDEEDDDIKKLLEDFDLTSEDISLNVKTKEEASAQCNLCSAELLQYDIAVLLKALLDIKIKDNTIEITFTRNHATITLSIIKTESGVYITDNADTFDYLKDNYNFADNDVKKRTNLITDRYHVTMQRNNDDRIALIKYGDLPEYLLSTFLDLYDCIVQLMDMSLFFDEPKED